MRLDDAGRKSSEFWLDGELVGRACWDEDGRLVLAVGLRDGKPHGYQLEYHENGTVSYAEPFVDGLVHGWSKQYDPRGRLLLRCPFKHGTGTDYWCDVRGRLHEEHPMVGNKLSGTDRWWDDDQKRVYEESGFLENQRHGVSRRWSEGELDKGFPQFFIHDERVTKRAYLKAARSDPTLPSYRSEDDDPRRELPRPFLELRDRVLRQQTKATKRRAGSSHRR